VDSGTAIGPIAYFEHAGIIESNNMCIIMNEYFYSYHTLGVLCKENLKENGKGE